MIHAKDYSNKSFCGSKNKEGIEVEFFSKMMEDEVRTLCPKCILKIKEKSV